MGIVQAIEGTYTLRTLLEENPDPFPGLNDVARRLKCSLATLHKYAPDSSQAIVSRHQLRWSDEVFIRVKQTLEDALTDAHPQSLTSIARQLTCDIGSLRRYFPNLCHAISARYAERINYEQIKKHLQEILAGERELLSLAEFARKEGCTPAILSQRFPDESKQIIEQCRIERRKQHMRKVEQDCIEVRQVVFMLHQQGIRPSSRILLRRVSNSHILRKKEVYETWRALLGELGYEADT